MSRNRRGRLYSNIPNAQKPIVAEGGLPDREWYSFWADSKTIETDEQTISNGTTTLIPHNQDDAPAQVWAVLRCKSAELGYETDDEVSPPVFEALPSGYGVSLVGSALNLILTIGDNGIRIMSKAAGSVGRFSSIDNNKWRVIVRARFLNK